MENIEYIGKQCQSMPQLSHASNILKKYNDKKELTEKQKVALDSITDAYAEYLKSILGIKSYTKADVAGKTAALNSYYNFLHDNEYDNLFSAQGKFRPTILEEFIFILFKDYVADVKSKHDKQNVLGSGNVKAYSNIYFKAANFVEFIDKPEIAKNEKDQDYAIFRSFEIAVDKGATIHVNVPAVAVEAKTYLDKTMLDSIIATAEKIKQGNPYARFVAVTERYDVSFSVDPAYSRVDQIYVLRKIYKKKQREEIDANVVWRFFEDTRKHLERPWSDIENKIKNDGVVI